VEFIVAEAQDRVTRVAAGPFDSAAAEGRRQSRSAKQQLDHWARVGRAVSSQHNASRRRVEAAPAGNLSMPDLTVEEGVVLARVNFGQILAERGNTTVTLDDAGRIFEYRPDGTSSVVAR
jgi:hypothetical protein